MTTRADFRIYQTLLAFLRPFWAQAMGTGLLMLAGSLLQLPAPLLTRHLFDQVLPSGDAHRLNLFVLLLVALVLMGAGVGLFQTRLSQACRYGAEAALRRSALNRLLAGRRDVLEAEASGYMVSRLDDDIGQIQHLLLDPMLTLMLQGLTFCVGVGLVFHLHPRMAIVALVSLPLFVITLALFSALFSKRMSHLMAVRQERWAQFRSLLQEGMAQSALIQACNLAGAFGGRCDEESRKALAASRRMEWGQALAGALTGLTATMLPLFVLWFGTREIMAGRFTVGGFIAFNTCVGYLYGPVRAMVSLKLDLSASLAAGRRVMELLDTPPAEADFGGMPLLEFQGLETQGLAYSYPGAERGLAPISFRLARGRCLALVGETGAGKSTLVKLLLGFIRASEGEIRINGRDMYEYSLTTIRDALGYVPQEPTLLRGSLRDNICLWDPEPDPEWINALIETCQLREALGRFPEGLDTQVQEAGTSLSGGEKQRVAVARALYRKPGLLLLDEATSAMDPETEGRLMRALLDLPWRPAILAITHRRGHLEHFDGVLVIGDAGMIPT